ncbi:MAG: citrate synthase, partial [Clostridia bacterium]|nr:citrate synthase [Clostridia bacterium]
MSIIESKFTRDDIKSFSDEIRRNYYINPAAFANFNVKRGLRNADGTGVMAGVTRVCSVEGYYIVDGEKAPREGHLTYRGVELSDIVEACIKENRFGYEEVAWLLLFGKLPTKDQLEFFNNTLAGCRDLPEDFIEDM